MNLGYKNRLAVLGMTACTAYFNLRNFFKSKIDYADEIAIGAFFLSFSYLFYRMRCARREIDKQTNPKSKILKAYEQYDGFTTSASLNPLHRRILLGKILEDVNPEDKTLVSLGGGSGRIENKFASLGARVINVDISRRDLRKCKNKNPDIECIVADAEYLPLREESADILFSGEVVGHLNPSKAFEEAYSVLKQNGIAKISTYSNTIYNRYIIFKSTYDLYPFGELEKIARDTGFNYTSEEEYDSVSVLFIPRKMTILTAKK